MDLASVDERYEDFEVKGGIFGHTQPGILGIHESFQTGRHGLRVPLE
jgi:hypothetical protein